jgi:hypothetical protein
MRSALVLATVLGVCLLLGVGVVGCLGKPQFECGAGGDCLQNGVQGVCQPTQFCSFPDSSCDSGQRYGDLSGPMANQCVGVPIDAPVDAYVHDAYVHDARECFGGSGAYQLCFAMMPPMGTVMLAGTLNTDNDARCMTPPASWITANQPDACMIVGKTITIAAIAVTGTKPLIVLGDTVAINGTLDVASHRGGTLGPGSPFGTCPAYPAAPANNAGGAGGGAGASFMRIGGGGGLGNGNSTAGTPFAALGANPTVLRAGCDGQVGGAAGANLAGAPGRGGGAVYVTASRITFSTTGAINASGSGAVGAGNLTGGSGGGSGGMIVLHATETITAMAGAKLMANGGGAASGANNNAVGDFGDDPSVGTPTTPAAGGDAGNNAGTGGAGFAGSTNAGTGQSAGGARDTGGGGGGGGGFIQSNMTISNMTASPSVTVVP